MGAGGAGGVGTSGGMLGIGASAGPGFPWAKRGIGAAAMAADASSFIIVRWIVIGFSIS